MTSSTVKPMLFVLFGVLFALVLAQESTNDTFVPTNEFQEIKEGQSVPPGLHYRINLSTRKKEAKLLEENESPPDAGKNSALSSVNEPEDAAADLEASKKRLEEALKGIPADTFDYDEEEMKRINDRFKSYQQIKKDFEAMDMGIKTDKELMESLIDRYKAIKDFTAQKDELGAIFEDLEYLAHQVDNAVQFVDFGGLTSIILPNLVNQSNSEVKVHSLKLLGALVQNNPKAKIAAFEKNLGHILTQIIGSNSADKPVTSAAIYALSGLIRKFPLAIKENLQRPGLTSLVSLFAKDVDLNLKIKSLTLIADLYTDRQQSIAEATEQKDAEKVRQYRALNFEKDLEEIKFCLEVEEMFIEQKAALAADVDATNRILGSLQLFKDFCFADWSESALFRHTLLVIINSFDRRTRQAREEELEYLNETLKALGQLRDDLYQEIVVQKEEKDEL